MSEASQIYKTLTENQKKFIASGGIDSKMSIPKWTKFLEPICRFDASVDEASGQLLKAIVVTSIALFVSFFIAVFADFMSLLFFGVPVLVVVLVVLSVLRFRFNRHNVNDNVRNVIYPLLNVLSLEVGHKQAVAMRINFKKTMAKQDISDIQGADTRGYNKDKSVVYLYDVLEIRATFMDNSRISINVQDKVIKRTRRNSSGKLKTKTKLKRRIGLHLNFDRELYELSSDAPSIPKNVVKVHSTDNWIKFNTMIKQSADGSTAELPMAELLGTVKTFYQFITVVKEKAA